MEAGDLYLTSTKRTVAILAVDTVKVGGALADVVAYKFADTGSRPAAVMIRLVSETGHWTCIKGD